LSLEVEQSDENGVLLLLKGPNIETRIQFKIAESPQFTYFSDEEIRIELVFGRRGEDIVDYLNDSPLNLMLDDWSRICGDEHFPAPAEPYNPFDREHIKVVDWRGAGVDIRVEYADNRGNVIASSIQLFLERALNVDGNSVVFWDHGSGEAADFIVLRRAANEGVSVSLYHCKGAGGAESGNRVDDVYEVCAQSLDRPI
jgi:hypothetical protein